MLFPDVPRYRYEENPLVAVICQVKYPPILRISAELPAAFQESVRQEFPLYSRIAPLSPPGLPPALAEVFRQQAPMAAAWPLHQFASSDNNWTIQLGIDALTFITINYTAWEDFRTRFMQPLRALQTCYAPPFFSRVGLRYQDFIQRSRYGLNSVGWNSLLQPHISGPLSDGNEQASILEAQTQFAVTLPHFDAIARVTHGLGHAAPEGSEQGYIIDTDFYTETQTEIPDAADRLDYFKGFAGRFFKGCISDELHHAMRPKEIR